MAGVGVDEPVGVPSGDSSSGALAKARRTAAPRSDRDPPRGLVLTDGLLPFEDEVEAPAAALPLTSTTVDGWGERGLIVGPLLDAEEEGDRVEGGED